METIKTICARMLKVGLENYDQDGIKITIHKIDPCGIIES
jgi:hypothetical protein